MSDYIQIPKEFPESWPDNWSGNTTIDCNSHGWFLLELKTEGHPSRIHVENYIEILKRWDQLWPQAHTVAGEMLKSYQRNYEIRRPQASLDINLPAMPIAEGAEWSIGIKFSPHDGEWDVTFHGWEAQPDESQPYF